MVRYCWNVGAVIQVWLNDIIWAGSMAMRRETIEDVELLGAWSRALSVDATVHRQLRKHNYKVRFVPSVIMVNREAVSLPRFLGWVQRQMIASKSCGSSWSLVGIHALILAGTQLLTLAIFVAACITGNVWAMQLTALGLGLYWGSSLLSIAVTESAIRQTVGDNGEQVRWSAGAFLRLIPGMLLTQVAYPYALCGALFRRRISWRGVEYDVNGVNNVVMRNYHPYIDRKLVSAHESVV